MSNNEFSFSLNLPGGSHAPVKRYIARPFEAHPVEQEAVILAAGAETSLRTPLFYTQMLAQCGQFRTLEAHVEQVMQTFGLPREQKSAVHQGLSGLVERGLLQDESAVHAQLASPAEGPAGPIQTLCIRTCDRPEDLSRLLDSLARRAAQSGLGRVLILDDGRDPEAMARTAAVVAAAPLPANLAIHHIDRAQRRQLVQRMANGSGVELQTLHWIIEGNDDDPEASYGANLNLALLLTAGQRFAMMDEDALFEPYALAEPADSLSLRVEHEFRVRFPDPEQSETAQFPALEIDPLAAHAALLGQPVGAIAADFGLQNGHLLSGLSPQMIHDFSARPRVRLTTNGTLGDSGTGGMLWLYSLPPHELKPWLDSQSRYRQLALGRRVARSTRELQIASSVSLMTTTLTGIDNRELLLPVPAKGRGEDLVFGAGVRFLYPGTPCAALPWMLPHRLESQRQWQEADLSRRQNVSLAAYLSERIEDLAELRLPDQAEARVAVLAQWLQSLGRMSEADLVIDLRRHLLERRSRIAAGVLKSLGELDPPDWLRTDFETIINGHRGVDTADTERLRQLVPPVRDFATRMGQALDSWVTVWQWAATQDPRSLLDPPR